MTFYVYIYLKEMYSIDYLKFKSNLKSTSMHAYLRDRETAGPGSTVQGMVQIGNITSQPTVVSKC